jgi:hypothetical protein
MHGVFRGSHMLCKSCGSSKFDEVGKLNDWRRGVELIASALGEKSPSDLSCVRLAERILELRAELEQYRGTDGESDCAMVAQLFIDGMTSFDTLGVPCSGHAICLACGTATHDSRPQEHIDGCPVVSVRSWLLSYNKKVAIECARNLEDDRGIL